MKLLNKLITTVGVMMAPLALAHSGHGAGAATDHVHFSVMSLMLVGAVLAVYFVVAHKNRARARVRREQQKHD